MSCRFTELTLFNDFNACLDKPISGVLLRRIFTSLIRVHWSDSGNFGEYDDTLSCLTYDDEEGKGTLTIQPTYVFDEKDTQNYPGIFVGLSIKYKKTVINNFAGLGPDGSDTYYVTPAEALIRIIHVHRSGDLAMAMAENTTAFLMGLRDPISDRLGLSEMDVLDLSDIRPVAEKPQRFLAVDLMLKVSFNMGMTVNLESHRLKKFAASIDPTL